MLLSLPLRALSLSLSLGLLGCESSDKPADTANGAPLAGSDLDGDGYASPDDCDDERVTINPGQAEVPFNGRDDDCNEATLDGDGDQDGTEAAQDCDDTDAAVHPGATEVCNEKDDNCDSRTDEGVAQTWFADLDADGYGWVSSPKTACEEPNGYVLNASDCDDAAPDISPAATETCDDRDEDCDGAVDDGVGYAQFADFDGDGFGDPAFESLNCDELTGYVPDDHDCDDTRGDVFPGAVEVCDLADQDCDGRIDEDVTIIFFADSDLDGFGDAGSEIEACELPAYTAENGDDCDDADAETFPGAPEYCNGRDDDCDGEVDPVTSLDAQIYARDADNDLFGDAGERTAGCDAPLGYVLDITDCNDADGGVFPGASETCNDVDDDCDGEIDPDTSLGAPAWYADSDGDGFGDPAAATFACDAPAGSVATNTDCDDLDPDVHPDAPELCNEEDDNCDSLIDPPESEDAPEWFADSDGDTFGDASTGTTSCEAPFGAVADATDCDDSRLLVNPVADELCNTIDDDCDGIVDPDSSVDAFLWYTDGDGDGFGFDASTVQACDAPTGHVGVGGDCTDSNNAIHPGAVELCNGVDDDCNDGVDEASAADAATWFADADGDGFGDAFATTTACDLAPVGYTADDSDCHDNVATAYPESASTETPGDGIDTDCDGIDACTDLNCDGRPDLVFGQHYDGNYTVDSYKYVQSGGTYAAAGRQSLTATGVHDAESADFDKDGYPDILLTNYFNDTTRKINAYIYWGSAAGYSTTDRTSLPTQGALYAAVLDLDDDGYLDIAFANHHDDASYSTSSYVYWGSAAGYSTADRTSLGTVGARMVLADDLDEDGYGDLIYCNYYSGTTYSVDSYIYWGSATGYSTGARTGLPTIGCFDVAVGDVDNDGWKDVLFANYFDGTTYLVNSYVYYGSAARFSSTDRSALPTAGTIGVEVGDFNNDGFDDAVFGGHFVGAWTTNTPTYVYWGGATGLSTASRTTLTTTAGVRDPKVGDLDSDGRIDLVFPRFYSGASYTVDSYVYWGSTTGFSDSDRSSLPGSGMASGAIGDLDADGFPEIVLGSYYSGSDYSGTSYVYWGSAAGYSSSDRTGISTIGVIPAPVLVGNIDW